MSKATDLDGGLAKYEADIETLRRIVADHGPVIALGVVEDFFADQFGPTSQWVEDTSELAWQFSLIGSGHK